MKPRTVPTVTCPECMKQVPVIFFGNGYVAVCCNKIIYRSDRPPEENEEKDD